MSDSADDFKHCSSSHLPFQPNTPYPGIVAGRPLTDKAAQSSDPATSPVDAALLFQHNKIPGHPPALCHRSRFSVPAGQGHAAPLWPCDDGRCGAYERGHIVLAGRHLSINHLPSLMSYLKDFGNKLAEKLSALPELERAEFITFVKTEVLTSYRNGLRDGAKDRTAAKTDARPAQHDQKSRRAPATRRNYQRQ